MTQDELRNWATDLGWRWDESCKWFAIDLHADGGGPLTTVLNKDAMELFYKFLQLAVIDARIDERKQIQLPFKGNHSECIDKMGCIGYQNADSDLGNENEIRIAELEDQKQSIEKGDV